MLRTGLLACVFVLSGACALVFETLWFHQAALAVGNSMWAASLVLAAFMSGMGIGNALAARYGERSPHTLLIYAGLEVTVALTGLALVYALPIFGHMFARIGEPLAQLPGLLSTLRFASAFLLMLVPSVAMGLTLPLLVGTASAWDRNFGRVLGVLYGANTFGAVLGAVACESWLIERFGIRGSAQLACASNLGAAVIAVVLARTLASNATALGAARMPAHRDDAAPRWAGGVVLVAGFLAGLLLLCLEIIWLRFLMLFLNDTPLAFALVLALVLAGIALGSVLASLWSSLSARAADHAYLVAYAGGLLGFAGYLLYPKLLRGSFPAYQSAQTILLLAAPLVMPACVASGALFTLLGVGLRRVTHSDTAATARLSLANTAGAGLGSLLAGFVLLPNLGMEIALLSTLAAYGAIGSLLAWSSPIHRGVRYAAFACFVASLAFFPFGMVRSQYIRASASRWTRGDAELVDVREGSTATLVHVVHRGNGVPLFDQIATNAYSMTGNGQLGRRYMKLFVYLPLALHPKVRRALVVGYGIGNTAQALTDSAELEKIDIVEVSRDMLDASRTLRVAHGRAPLDDPRVRVHIEDGRFFLQATSERYDLITAEPPPPIMAGVVHLYTTEYFQLLRSRLAAGGIATYWLPVINIGAPTAKSVIAGFCAAFADCSLWHGAAHNLMLMGTRDAHGPVSAARFARQWSDVTVRPELSNLGLELPAQLAALFIGDAPYLRALSADAPPLSDDWPARMQQPWDKPEREALLMGWRDAAAARERFQSSALIEALVPAPIRQQAGAQFDVQWLLNELLFSEPTVPHDTHLLHRVLVGTRLHWPVLLLLHSDSDFQQASVGLSAQARERPEWLVQRAAGHLAAREYEAALSLLERMPADQLPMPELLEYLETAVEQQQR